jgi:hypothetical protein
MKRHARLLLLALVTFGLALPAPGPAQAQSEIAEPFRTYYRDYQGLRILGHPLTGLVDTKGIPAQEGPHRGSPRSGRRPTVVAAVRPPHRRIDRPGSAGDCQQYQHHLS